MSSIAALISNIPNTETATTATSAAMARINKNNIYALLCSNNYTSYPQQTSAVVHTLFILMPDATVKSHDRRNDTVNLVL